MAWDENLEDRIQDRIDEAIATERRRCAQVARREAGRWRGIPGECWRARYADEIAAQIERGDEK